MKSTETHPIPESAVRAAKEIHPWRSVDLPTRKHEQRWDEIAAIIARECRIEKLESCVEALRRIKKGDACIVGLSPEFIGHARQIADEALRALDGKE